MTTIALDAMGSDHGPGVVARAAATLTLDPQGPRLLLVGDAATLEAELQQTRHDPTRLEVHHSPTWIAMDEKPATALDAKPEASIAVAARLVAEGRAQALVSAGNTGAVLLASAQRFGCLAGVRRAALAAVYPTEARHGARGDPFALMLDVGATLDASADDLVAFAVMGSAYARLISDNPSPKVALLSNGAEPAKGLPAIVAAHQRLATHPGLNFIGNIEGTDIPRGTADVIVTGGFVGNVVLKMLEGVSQTVVELARSAYSAHLMWRVGLWLLASGIRRVKTLTDWQHYGGAPILGLQHLCIKAHGRSRERAVRNAIKVATKAVDGDLVGTIQRGLS